MMYSIKFNGKEIGKALVGGATFTDEEICEIAGVELARTEEDFVNMPENGKYDLSELVIE